MTVTREHNRIVLHAQTDFERQAIDQILRQGVEAVKRDPALAWDHARSDDAMVLELRDPDRW